MYGMDCNDIIHNELKEMGYALGEFCRVRIVDDEDTIVNNYEQHCNKMELIKDKNINVCKICDSVHSYNLLAPYIDFYENTYKFRRKSVYIRKYHILNIINDRTKNNKQISFMYDRKQF